MIEAGAAWVSLETLATRAKAVKAIIDRLKDAEAKAAMLDLQEALLEAREKSLEDAALITELRQQLALQTEMKLEGDVFYRHLDGGEKQGPFCARCLQKDGNSVYLIAGDDYNEYVCPVCEKTAGWVKDLPPPPGPFVV